MAAIVHWSADNIRYSGITMGKGEGYTLHPGPMIFEDRSGVCKDKAGMAITMLRAAGFTAYPAMTMAGARVEKVPADQFNHCVVAWKKPDGSFEMLDPTWVVFSPELWSSAEGEQDYVIGTPEGEELTKTPAFDPEKNKVRIESQAVLDARGDLSGNLVITASGVADQRLRREMVHASPAADRQAWFEKVVAILGPGASVERVNVSYAKLQDIGTPVRFEVHYRVPGFALEIPLGWIEHREAFKPSGTYGAWLARQNAVIRIGKTLFLHRGLSPKYAEFSLTDLNERIRRELREPDPLTALVTQDEEGPLWYRVLARGDATASAHLEAVLLRHGVRRMVIGHTPTEGLVMPLFGGRVLAIDVGLARLYGGSPAALVLEGEQAFALHRGSRLRLPEADGEPVLQYVQEVAALEPDPARLKSLILRLEASLTPAPLL